MKLTTHEIADRLGLAPPPIKPTTSSARTIAATQTVAALDDRMEKLVRSQMLPHEGYEAAFDRFLSENPDAYTLYDGARRKLLRGLGIGDVAGGVNASSF